MAESLNSAMRVARTLGASASADFDLRAWGLAFVVDFRVVRTGEKGIERGWDLDLVLLFLHVCLSLYVVPRPYRRNEHYLDAMLDYAEGIPSPTPSERER